MTLTLTWSANPPGEQIAHYNVYQTVNGGMQTKIGETVDPTFSITDPAPGNYSFNVSATNLAGEGPQSDPVAGPAIPSKPMGLAVTVV